MTKDIESTIDEADSHSDSLRSRDDQGWAAAEDTGYYREEPPDCDDGESGWVEDG